MFATPSSAPSSPPETPVPTYSKPLLSTYLVRRASFVACHQFSLLDRVPVLELADEGATFLLNSPFGPDQVWDRLPRDLQETILARRIRLYVIDGYRVARQAGIRSKRWN